MTQIEQRGTARSGYWYPEHGRPTSVDVLNLLRRYRAAEAEMRARTRSSMGMGETDLLALRLLLRAERRGDVLRQRDLAAALGLASPSVTALVDRLVKSGHVRREPHPDDRRATIVVPTSDTDAEVRATLGAMHRRMIDVIDAMDDEQTEAVAGFLERMVAAIEHVDEHEHGEVGGA
ncbi:MarR family winged helix-turn-helix transcriptional regulator [Agrococcus sp. TF02-05]|uniref:MarR family winged helix-turn-helix transcriptional regulator n=1 Tax=Agrococcus sp. TF02-05 TaxID=2815211 RepID=UPI001AA1C354|nr:MarR family transcriptional regulator [Agrococcus sp. TF02-05]MBO1768694.1 MarR family transcriptional regulator [Agrococcus sp. TF02-05]